MLYANWPRQTVLALIAHLPLVLTVILSGPLLLLGPFLPQPLREHAFRQLRELRGWSRDILDRCNLC
jgi:hypothetical protein